MGHASKRFHPAMSVLVAVALTFMIGATAVRMDTAPRTQPTAAPDPAPSVRLVIDYGDGVQKVFTSLTWNDGMTALDAMEAAAEHPRGIELDVTGRGETAFIRGIDDLKNEGAAGQRRNWLYSVNGEPADRGAGAFLIEPNDEILWKYGRPADRKQG